MQISVQNEINNIPLCVIIQPYNSKLDIYGLITHGARSMMFT